jgi:hypothetical protein
VREVEVRPAELVVMAMIVTIIVIIEAPAELWVTFWKIWMNGKPVGDERRLSRSPRENSSMRQYPRPKMPFSTTLPTIAMGTLRAG